jgi:hypothetical protein
VAAGTASLAVIIGEPLLRPAPGSDECIEEEDSVVSETANCAKGGVVLDMASNGSFETPSVGLVKDSRSGPVGCCAATTTAGSVVIVCVVATVRLMVDIDWIYEEIRVDVVVDSPVGTE